MTPDNKKQSILIQKIKFKGKITDGLEVEYVKDVNNVRDVVRLNSSDAPELALVDCWNECKYHVHKHLAFLEEFQFDLRIHQMNFSRPNASHPEAYVMECTGETMLSTCIDAMKFTSPKKLVWIAPTQEQISDGKTEGLNNPLNHFTQEFSDALNLLHELVIAYINGRRQQANLFDEDEQ